MNNTPNKKNEYKFSSDELSGICTQLALVLRSGIMVSDGLEAMCDVQDKSSRAQEILRGMAAEMHAHGQFFEAAEKTGAFPSYMLGMVELGEKTGKLDEVMAALSRHYKREERLRATIFGSVFYPAVLCAMIIVVIAVLITNVLPVFSRVLEDMGAEPSAFVRVFLYIGGPGSRYVLIAALVLFAAGFALFVYSKLRGSDAALRVLTAMIPPARCISAKMSSGRFASAMSMALASGCDMYESFGLINKVITHKRTAEKVKKIEAAVIGGTPLSQAAGEAGIFTGMAERMVSVGDKAGKLDDVMREIAEHLEEETATELNNLAAVIEPVMVAFLAVVTGAILLSVMLPLIEIISSI